MNSKSKVSIIAAAVIAGIAMLLIMGQWNSSQPPMSDGSLVQTPEASPVADSTEPTSNVNDIVSETTTAPAVEQTSSSQPIVEQPVTETVNSGESANDASTAIVNTENIVEQSSPSSVTYVTTSGGGGHGSSHSSSHNSQGNSGQSSNDNVNTSTDEQTDSGTGQGTSNTDGTQSNPSEETTSGTGQQDSNSGNNQNEQSQDQTNEGTTSDGGANTNPGSDQDDSLPDDDESFFVLPESPVGAAALVMSSLAVLGGFMFLRNRSHSNLPI